MLFSCAVMTFYVVLRWWRLCCQRRVRAEPSTVRYWGNYYSLCCAILNIINFPSLSWPEQRIRFIWCNFIFALVLGGWSGPLLSEHFVTVTAAVVWSVARWKQPTDWGDFPQCHEDSVCLNWENAGQTCWQVHKIFNWNLMVKRSYSVATHLFSIV